MAIHPVLDQSGGLTDFALFEYLKRPEDVKLSVIPMNKIKDYIKV